MKLFGSWLSPYAARVLIAARYKRIDLDVVAPAGLRGPELLAISPIGRIPVLEDRPVVLPESQVIVEYLEERFPQPTLLPGDAAHRANQRLLVRLMDTYSAPSFGPFIAGGQPAIDEAIARIDTALGYVDHFRLDGGFASGDTFSVADCAMIPFFHIFEVLQDGFGTFDLVRKHPRLEDWWSGIRTSEIGSFARGNIDQAIARMQAQ